MQTESNSKKKIARLESDNSTFVVEVSSVIPMKTTPGEVIKGYEVYVTVNSLPVGNITLSSEEELRMLSECIQSFIDDFGK